MLLEVNSLESRFLASFDLHDPIRFSETMDSLDEYVAEGRNAGGVVGAAARIIAGQAVRRLFEDLHRLRELDAGLPAVILEAEANMGLLLALFITGREAADGGVLVTAGEQKFGDHPDGLSELRVDVGASQGDFDVEFLLTWDEHGPNPAHYTDDTQPVGLRKTYRVALIRDPASGSSDTSDRKTRRLGLESQGLIVETYTDEEAERDPFGVIARTFKRIQRGISDDYTE